MQEDLPGPEEQTHAPGFDWSQPPGPPNYAPTAAPPGQDPFDRLIPAKNPSALIAYYCGVFSLVPCLALLLGLVAVILGIWGLKAIEKQPELPGKAHAWVGIALGGITFLANAGFLIYVLTQISAQRH